MKNCHIPRGIMVFCSLLAFLCGQESAAKIVAAPAPSQRDLLEVKVLRLVLDPSSMQPVVLLRDPAGDRVMPIWIGPNEATAIQGELEGIRFPRPLTHDLLEQVIQRFDGTLRRAVITQEKEGIYHAVIVLEKEKIIHELDARPSDSIALALKFKAPVLVSRILFDQKAISLQEQKSAEESYGLTPQELTPALAESFSFAKGKGALIADVTAGSRAEKDGLQRGDIVVEIGDEKIEGPATLTGALARMKRPLKVKVFRKGNWKTLTLNPVAD